MERSGAVSVLSGVETEPVGPKKGRGQPELGRSPGTDWRVQIQLGIRLTAACTGSADLGLGAENQVCRPG